MRKSKKTKKGSQKVRRQAHGKAPRKELYLVVAAIALVGAASIYFGSGMYPTEKIAESEGFQKYPGILFEYEVTRYPVIGSVVDVTKAYDGPGDAMNFGVAAADEDYIVKYVSLENLRDEPAKMSLIARGEIGKFITFNRNNFVLQSGERATVEVYFRPRGLAPGTHMGDLEVVVKRAKHPYLMGIW